MKCENCKHWTRNAQIQTELGQCRCEKFVYTGDEDTPNDGLGYWDFESYRAGFETGENFGCIHFEEG